MNKKVLLFFTLTILLIASLNGQENDNKKDVDPLLNRFYDLADNSPEKAIILADSIKLNSSIIEDDKIKFHKTLALVYFGLQNFSQSYINYNTSLAEAIKQKEYATAGRVHIEICDVLIAIGDTISVKEHFESAIQLYEKTTDSDGLLEVVQAEAFFELAKGNHKKSNTILKKYHNEAKKSSDGLFYLVSNYFFLTNYLELDKKEEAFKYLDTIKTLHNKDNNPDFKFYKGVTYLKIADYFDKKNNLDSVAIYLSKIKKSELEIDFQLKTGYYKYLSKIYKKNGNIELYQQANDTLSAIQQKIIVNNGKTNINNEQEKRKLIDYLKNEQKKNNYQYIFIFIVLVLVTATIVFYGRKRLKKLKTHTEKMEKDLPKVHSILGEKEKLRITLKEKDKKLEKFKKEIKTISKLPNTFLQREKIKELSKEMLIESLNNNTVDNQYEELKGVNTLFFEKLQEKYPSLNSIEQIICYYIHIDFKNKEIAELLNTSIRAIESRRYRITKNIATTTSEKVNLREVLGNVI